MLVSKSTIVVRYAETDQMGITHHSVYPIWYEVARTDYIKHLGLTYSEMERMGIQLPLVDLQCHYRDASRYEDELTVTARTIQLSPAKVTFGYEVYRKGEEKPINTGSTTHAWVDGETFRVMNFKKKHPQLYADLTKAMEE